MKLTLDVENTVTKRDGKMYLDPFEPDNRLVMVGCLTDTGKEYLYRDDFSGWLLYTSPSPRDAHESRMPSSA